MTPARLLTASDVAEILGVRVSLVHALVRRGELPRIPIGDRCIRFRAEAVQAWIEEQETTERKGTQS